MSLRHSRQETAAKLSLAAELSAAGETKVSICKKLRISVMTLHRWQKRQANLPRDTAAREFLVGELKLENNRLRRIASNLTLEIAEGRERLASPASATKSPNVKDLPGPKAA